MSDKFIKYMTEAAGGKPTGSKIFMGKANDNMAKFLTALEDQIDRDYFDTDKTKHKKFNSDLARIDLDWDKLWDKIVKLVKAI